MGKVSDKMKMISATIASLEKHFGKGAIMALGDANVASEIETISSGSLTLDMTLGVGGLPKGRLIEIYGPESSGKTTLALHAIAEAQRKGGICAFIDAEHALDIHYAQAVGARMSELLVSQPDCGEQALEIADHLIRSGTVALIVVDSVAALVPKAEIEGEMGDSMMGLQARLMSQALRKLTGAINKSKSVVIFTNQIRQKIGVMFGNPETTPGGLALKFYASVRIDVRKIANIKTPSGESIGSQHRARIIKNKVAPPFKETEFDIMNLEGISVNGSLVDLAIQYGFITKAGAFFKIGDQNIQGREGAKNYLKENQKAAVELTAKIWESVRHPETQPAAKSEE